MTDLNQVLTLWQELHASGAEYVLATVVEVEGSGYRKPGARMLIAADGRRRGTISGGCLEGEVAQKAFWHTEHGPVVRRYSTNIEDGEVPYGMGCGGVVHLLLERSATAEPLLRRLADHFSRRRPLAIATVLEGKNTGHRVYCEVDEETGRWHRDWGTDLNRELAIVASKALQEQRSFTTTVHLPEELGLVVRAEWIAARPGLFIFGAGDDAIPVARQARQLGWHVSVADGRTNLATRGRFPEADTVHVLEADTAFPESILRRDAAVVMTHSLEQDTRALRMLLGSRLSYVGVLGPRRRTLEIVHTLALELNRSEPQREMIAAEWMDRLARADGAGSWRGNAC